MDESIVQENLKKIFIMEIITAALGIAIIVLITRVGINVSNFDVSYYIGVSMCGTFAVAIPVVVCVLSGIAKANIKTAPKLVYIFSIITLIGSIGGSGACIIGAASIADSIGKDVYWYEYKLIHGGYPPADVYIENLGLHIAVAVLFVILVVLLILVLVSAAKNIKESSDVMGTGMAASAPRASSQAAAAGGSGGNFCQQCGNSNEPGAKFCKKCGKVL